MNEQLSNTIKSTADFLKGLYSDPSVTLRVREQSRIKEIALRQAIVDFESVLTALADTTAKPTKKLKTTPMMVDDSHVTPMEDTSVSDSLDKENE